MRRLSIKKVEPRNSNFFQRHSKETVIMGEWNSMWILLPTKEGLSWIGRFRSNCNFCFHVLGLNKPIESLFGGNKPQILYYKQHIDCKHLKYSEYFTFNSKISLGRFKLTISGVRKVDVFLRPWFNQILRNEDRTNIL